MTTTYEDATGAEISVDSYVAYATTQGRSATIRFGKVVRLAEREVRAYIGDRYVAGVVGTLRAVTVDRDRDGTWSVQCFRRARAGRPIEVTLGELDRVIVLAGNRVPIEARRLLDRAARALAQGKTLDEVRS